MRRAPHRALLPLIALLPAAALARYPLRALPRDVVMKLRPFAERGELALIESNKDGTLRQLALVTVVRAPMDAMYRAISTTEEYTQFVPNVVKSDTVKQVGETRWVAWELEVPLFNLTGTNAYTFHAPDAMDVETSSGDVRTGAWRWELFPLSENSTLAVEYAYSDVRDVNFVMRKLIAKNRTVEHGAVLSAATVFMKSAKARAEKRAGVIASERPDVKKNPRAVPLKSVREFATADDFAALAPLFDRGIVALVQSQPDGRLHQAVVFARTYAPPEKVYEIAAHPDRWDEFMPGVDECYAIEDVPDHVVYRMELDAPLLSINFKARMNRGPDWLSNSTLDGDLKNARFGWEFLPQPEGRSLTIYYVNADLRRNSWVLRHLIDRDPFFEHGVNVAAGLLALNLIRGKAEGWLPRKKKD